jgi:hypothetical protein
LIGKPERKRPLGRHRCRWEDNIKMNSREILFKGISLRENGGSCTMRNFIICTHPQIRQIKSRRMRWAGHVARMGEERKVCKVLV